MTSSERAPEVPESVRVHRQPERGAYDRDTIDAILDASVVCHLATVDDDGRPLVIPMQHARVGDVVYLHGSSASRHLKRAALQAFVERLLPGRWDEADQPDEQEIKATIVLRLPITEASAKSRSGWPGHVDEEDDLSRLWVGVIPVAEVAGSPAPHPDLPADVPVSASVAAWAQSHSELPSI